jgi:bifunctional non-homologous end joining protein LigD
VRRRPHRPHRTAPHRTAIEHLGLTARPKVTGRRSIQIWIPVAGPVDFPPPASGSDGCPEPSAGCARIWSAGNGWSVTGPAWTRLDYTQNAINRTLVAPYSPRAAAGGPVSMPIDRDELDDAELTPDRWTIRSAPVRLAARSDLFRSDPDP